MWHRSAGQARADHRIFFVGVGLFLCSFAIWVTDMIGTACDPHNHLITGHAIWHVLNAICVWRLAVFYRLPR